MHASGDDGRRAADVVACTDASSARASLLLHLLPAATRRAVAVDALLLPTLVDATGLSPRATPVHVTALSDKPY